eukprot:SAG11_NODE_1419_length_4957_cov_3.968711_2_plen_120_part_00
MKGHSADGGNDRADASVQWGKGDHHGPFARLRNNGGEGESRHGDAANWVALQTNETTAEERAAEARGAANSVALETNVIVGRRGLEEADQAIEVFKRLAKLGNETNGEDVSNGVLLESQ